MEYDPFVIAVAGGTASGKTTVCDLIMQRLHDQCVAIVAQDSFYKVLTPAERELAAKGGVPRHVAHANRTARACNQSQRCVMMSLMPLQPSTLRVRRAWLRLCQLRHRAAVQSMPQHSASCVRSRDINLIHDDWAQCYAAAILTSRLSVTRCTSQREVEHFG